MQRHRISGWSLVAVLALAAPLAARPQTGPAAEPKANDQFIVKLADGSSLVCTPKLDVLPIKTSFAEVKIPLQKLEAMKLDHKEKVSTLSFLNGDRLQGECMLPSIAVSSLLGDLTIPLTNIAEVVTTLKKTPVYEDTPANRKMCINNLRIIDAAKEQWAMEAGASHGQPVDLAGCNQYIRGNATPVCPAGGTYTYNRAGTPPECSCPGHALP